MASTVYDRFRADAFNPDCLGDWSDFSFGEGVDTFDCLIEVWQQLVANKLPDCLDWCGDELLIELDADNKVSAEDEKELEGFDLDKIVSEACDELFNMSDEELITLAKKTCGYMFG